MGIGMVFGIGLALTAGSILGMLESKRFDGFGALLSVTGVAFMVLAVVSIFQLQGTAP